MRRKTIHTSYFSRITIWLIPATMLLFSFPLFAQDAHISARLDTTALPIGGQTRLTLELKYRKGLEIRRPALTDAIGKVEIVKKEKTDTLYSGEEITELQQLIITSFDSGYHVIPPFILSYRHPANSAFDSASSEALLLSVNTVPVDTTKEIRDIKGPIDVPLTWQEIARMILWGILALAAVIGLYLLIRRRKQPVAAEKPLPKRPPAEVALEALAALEKEKLWQSGDIKGYYSRISDILRAYLEDQFRFHAMEMTSDEIIHVMDKTTLATETRLLLTRFLWLADMVKFAKARPVASEHEGSLQNATEFIKQTSVLPHAVTAA